VCVCVDVDVGVDVGGVFFCKCGPSMLIDLVSVLNCVKVCLFVCRSWGSLPAAAAQFKRLSVRMHRALQCVSISMNAFCGHMGMCCIT